MYALHPFKRIFVITHAIINLSKEEVAFRIGCDAVDVKELPGIVAGMTANRCDRFQGLSIKHPDRLIGAIDYI